MAAMLKAANEGQYNFLSEVKVYGDRAQKLKEIFLRHGFYLVYDNDLGDPIADGFYFTIGYPGMTSGELAKELMYYGVSAIHWSPPEATRKDCARVPLLLKTTSTHSSTKE